MLFFLFIANLKMIYRNRQALFWALVFPLLFVVIFGLFQFDQPPTVDLAIVDHAGDELSESLVKSLEGVEFLELDAGRDEEAARQALADGDVGYVLIIPEGLAQH